MLGLRLLVRLDLLLVLVLVQRQKQKLNQKQKQRRMCLPTADPDSLRSTAKPNRGERERERQV
jgi:hypothetical protein